MDIQRIINILKKGEGIRIEFKESKTKLPSNLFESICAMLNRDGGDIILGADDRLYIKTNLIDAYDELMGFITKHLPDKFFIEGDQRKSLRLLILTQLHKHIYSISGKHIMLDEDLAKLYGVKTKYLNQAVSRNIERFPKKFRFQLSKEEFNDLRCQIDTLEDDQDKILRSQIATLNDQDRVLSSQNATIKSPHGQHRKYLPYVFTEQGVSMLSAVLRSETAIKVSIQIMDAFVKMRHYLSQNQGLLQRMDHFEFRLQDTDIKVKQLFKALDEKHHKIKEGVFFEGQIFDAYLFVSNLVKRARTISLWCLLKRSG